MWFIAVFDNLIRAEPVYEGSGCSCAEEQINVSHARPSDAQRKL